MSVLILVSGIDEPIQAVPAGGRNGDLVFTVNWIHRIGNVRPVRAGKIRGLLQSKTGRGRGPGQYDRVGGSEEQAEKGRARRLHSVNGPEATGKGVRAAGQRTAGVMLSGRARNLIWAAGAGATPACRFVRINRVLGGSREGNEADQNC